MEYFLLFASIVFVIFLLSLLLKMKKSHSSQKKEQNQTFVRCPVCESVLLKGENLHSKIFRPMNTPDQRMTVQGCPHCFPFAQEGIVRRCPVCTKILTQNDELSARLFNRPDGKKHVIITGCSICTKRK